jgi:hypothetical protein
MSYKIAQMWKEPKKDISGLKPTLMNGLKPTLMNGVCKRCLSGTRNNLAAGQFKGRIARRISKPLGASFSFNPVKAVTDVTSFDPSSVDPVQLATQGASSLIDYGAAQLMPDTSSVSAFIAPPTTASSDAYFDILSHTASSSSAPVNSQDAIQAIRDLALKVGQDVQRIAPSEQVTPTVSQPVRRVVRLSPEPDRRKYVILGSLGIIGLTAIWYAFV